MGEKRPTAVCRMTNSDSIDSLNDLTALLLTRANQALRSVKEVPRVGLPSVPRHSLL